MNIVIPFFDLSLLCTRDLPPAFADDSDIFAAIRALNERDKLTVFLVEQNAYHALKLAHRGYVMVNGEITLHGQGRELLQRPEIRAAYLEGGSR